MTDKSIYTTVLSQTFSPCGNYLIAANTYGEIAVFNIPKVIAPAEVPNERNLRTPVFGFTPCPDSQISSLATTEDFLVIGTVGEILGYEWDSVLKQRKPELSWSLNIPPSKDNVDKPDVNSLSLRENREIIYAGCGDNNVYGFDLGEGKLVQTFDGHEDYIHSVSNFGGKILSASEDGTARIWDPRRKKEVHTIAPHKHESLARPSLGKWLGAASFNEDWLVCGGGPHLSLWHLRSMTLAETYTNMEDQGIYVADLYGDRIFAGGASNHMTHLSLTGGVLAEVPLSATCLYSLAYQETPHKVMCMAGSSHKIDFCTNFNYRDQILTFNYKK
ncbi:THO complex subunit 6 homolog [Neocloeon triangulifer]|uniref:THO complex subunit 6 homolog n=1 Tax=Neocloeon triangulifer TaxID=2078957 RepID=UPI00286F3C16|nr:THO complex subunit 6 homolog [Neocloeon triangulifer]